MVKQRSLIASIHRDNDTPAMFEAIGWLEQAGWSFYRPTNVQLKIDEDISYYPDRGTIMIDGYNSRCSESGLPALQALCDSRAGAPPIPGKSACRRTTDRAPGKSYDRTSPSDCDRNNHKRFF